MQVIQFWKVFLIVIFIGTSPLNALLTEDKSVTYYTARGGDPTGTTGDPNQLGGLSDTGNTVFGSFKSTLSVVDKDTYKITMNTNVPSLMTFLIEGVDWGNMGTINTISVTGQPLTVPNIWRTSTRFAVRTTQALTSGTMVTIDVTGVHVPEPKTYLILGTLLGACLFIYAQKNRRFGFEKTPRLRPYFQEK